MVIWHPSYNIHFDWCGTLKRPLKRHYWAILDFLVSYENFSGCPTHCVIFTVVLEQNKIHLRPYWQHLLGQGFHLIYTNRQTFNNLETCHCMKILPLIGKHTKRFYAPRFNISNDGFRDFLQTQHYVRKLFGKFIKHFFTIASSLDIFICVIISGVE